MLPQIDSIFMLKQSFLAFQHALSGIVFAYVCDNKLIQMHGFLKLFVAVLLLAATSCSHKSETYKLLVKVDSLVLGHHNADSAIQILRNIEPKSKEESAYYNILEAAASFKGENPVKSFSGINSSIKYYTNNYDARKLAYSYYYKSTIFINKDSLKREMITLFKNAEQHALKTTDYQLLCRVYSGLTFTNSTFAEKDEALKFAHKELAYAQKLNDNLYKTTSLMHLALIHYYMTHDSDSASYYIRQCESLADDAGSEIKYYIYNYIGQTLMQNNPSTAKQYFKNALMYNKQTEAFLNLAKILAAENNYEESLKYCDSALLIKSSLDSREETYRLMAKYYYENKDIEQYKRITDELINTKEALSQYKEDRKLLELQQKFDFENQRADYEIKIHSLVGIIGLATFISLIIFLLHRISTRRTENNRMASELRYEKLKSNLVLYEGRIAELETEKKSQSKEMLALKNKTENQRLAMRKNLQHGRELYYRLNNCESPASWSDHDILCLLDFVTTFDSDFAETLEFGYDNLNTSQKMFMVADKLMKKDDIDICRMFNLNKDSLRNKRNRLAKKKVNKSTI